MDGEDLRLEFMLGVLIAQGASTAAAMTYAAMIDRYILGSGLAHPSGPSPEDQFRLGLGFLLDGIARCLAGAESQARSGTMRG